jgi:hypothetical protein
VEGEHGAVTIAATIELIPLPELLKVAFLGLHELIVMNILFGHFIHDRVFLSVFLVILYSLEANLLATVGQ